MRSGPLCSAEGKEAVNNTLKQKLHRGWDPRSPASLAQLALCPAAGPGVLHATPGALPPSGSATHFEFLLPLGFGGSSWLWRESRPCAGPPGPPRALAHRPHLHRRTHTGPLLEWGPPVPVPGGGRRAALETVTPDGGTGTRVWRTETFSGLGSEPRGPLCKDHSDGVFRAVPAALGAALCGVCLG